MTLALIAVALLLVVAVVVAVWLGLSRARLLTDVLHAEEAALASKADLDAARAEARALAAQADQFREKSSELAGQCITLRGQLEQETRLHREHLESLSAAHARELSALRDTAADHRAQLEKRLADQQARFKEMMDAVAGEALRKSGEQLLRLADENFTKHHASARAEIEKKVQPITDTLKRADDKLAQLEKQRVEAYSALKEGVIEVARTSQDLRKETERLFRALSKPQVRGRYGEIQLRRVLEIAGMRDYCKDFTEQATTRGPDQDMLRPDVVVRLPNDRCIVIDAKANLDGYLQALDATNPEDAERHMESFASHVAEQAKRLASKNYQSRFDGAAEFVVMFIPGDQFIDAALQRRPDLLDLAIQHRVIIASPSTLIGLLSAVHVGWRERKLADSAEELRKLGKELHERVDKVLSEIVGVGKSLDTATSAYNRLVGSVDSRMMPTLRKFEAAGACSDKPVPELKVLTDAARTLRALPQGEA